MVKTFSPKKTITFIFLFALINFTLTAGCIYKLELQASFDTNGNHLTWSTKSESNNQYFIVERSINGIDFERAGKVNAVGNSTKVNEYSFSDLNKNKKYTRYFYRLVQLDFDDTESFSHVVIIIRNLEDRLFNLSSINSSLVDQYFNLNLNSKVKGELSYNLQTHMGDILLKGKFPVTKGSNAVSVDFNDLEVGRYQFALKVKNEITVIQVKKVNSSELPTINLATKNQKKKN
ncbi:MAG: hypothetical protein AB8F94_17445 [Saprospiraceae bacterium]